MLTTRWDIIALHGISDDINVGVGASSDDLQGISWYRTWGWHKHKVSSPFGGRWYLQLKGCYSVIRFKLLESSEAAISIYTENDDVV